MALVKRIFVSMPADQWLMPNQNDLKWAIVEEIERLGYVAEIFLSPKGKPSLVAGKAWSAIRLDEVMRRCVGAVVIGAPRWVFPGHPQDIKLATEFNQYEGAVAYTLNLPMLVLIQNDVERRVIFDQSYQGFVGQFSPSADRTWLTTSDFLTPFNYWKEELTCRRDIFLGYCSSSTKTALELKRFLTSKVGATVLDWQDPNDFKPARSILQEIEEAAKRCSAGIFLFTKDDQLLKPPPGKTVAPRDNVVFEAGYFINAKGKESVLIVVEQGAKIPADLGGDIYASLVDKTKIKPIEAMVRGFVSAL
jgi:hypothetical protein